MNSWVCDTIDRSSPAAGVGAAAGMEAVFGAGADAEGACCMLSVGLEQAARRDMDRIEQGFHDREGNRWKGFNCARLCRLPESGFCKSLQS